MALKQNTTLLAQLPLRQIGGSPGTFRSMWSRGDRMNQSVGQGITSQLAGIPSGVPHPGAWVMPYKPGRMSSRNAQITITAAATGVRGLQANGAATFTLTASAVGGLIVSATGSATFTIFTNSPLMRGSLAAQGSATFSIFTNTPTLGAIANISGSAAMTFTASAGRYAVGHMVGSALPYTELSPQSLAAAVWSAQALEYNDTGTMGNKLNNAASGGVDYNALADAVWDKTLP